MKPGRSFCLESSNLAILKAIPHLSDVQTAALLHYGGRDLLHCLFEIALNLKAESFVIGNVHKRELKKYTPQVKQLQTKRKPPKKVKKSLLVQNPKLIKLLVAAALPLLTQTHGL